MSFGVLLYRRARAGLEVFLVHPGGPFWAGRDAGAWTIPKGEPEEGEEPLAAARREFAEETGLPPPDGPWIDLGQVTQKAGKVVQAWAAEGDADPALLRSNTFPIEWPPGSGRRREFPEIDRAGWFTLSEAREKLIEAQRELLDRLAAAAG